MEKHELYENLRINVERERIRLKMTQADFAKSIGLSLTTYKRFLSSESIKFDIYTLYLLYKKTGKLGFQFGNDSDPYLDLIDKITTLDQSQLSFISDLIDFQKSLTTNTDKDMADDYVTVFIPTGNMHDGMLYDSTSYEAINIAAYRKKYGVAIHCGIRITSNHLHPVYYKNDILLISRTPIRDGDTGVFIDKTTGCCYLRKFYQTSPCSLVPLNGYGETFYVDDNNPDDMNKWIKFGRVLTKMR